VPVLVCISIVIFDQIVKSYIQSIMLVGMSIPVIPDVFHITYILNPGAAFGILENQRMFFILIGIAILCAAIYFYSYIKKENVFIRYGVSMLLGGAVGNLIDRVRIGYVVDFFDFRIWPIFNIADIAIVVGVGCIVYSVLFINKLK
jgi:signal peptidase II